MDNDQSEHDEEAKRPRTGGSSLGAGIAIGTGVGAALFAATGSVVWIAVGAAIGVAVGASLQNRDS